MRTVVAVVFCVALLCREAVRELLRPGVRAANVADMDLRHRYRTR